MWCETSFVSSKAHAQTEFVSLINHTVPFLSFKRVPTATGSSEMGKCHWKRNLFDRITPSYKYLLSATSQLLYTQFAEPSMSYSQHLPRKHSDVLLLRSGITPSSQTVRWLSSAQNTPKCAAQISGIFATLYMPIIKHRASRTRHFTAVIITAMLTEKLLEC